MWKSKLTRGLVGLCVRICPHLCVRTSVRRLLWVDVRASYQEEERIAAHTAAGDAAVQEAEAALSKG